ncbi:MAG: polyprenyl synthetase family protein [candidate division Zixibacteria bacterium]|nr:polyprenyl synthetase family protein [candidate division Zixibacteria bacterium]
MPAEAVDIKVYFKNGRELVDRLLDQYLPAEDAEPRTLHTAMRYSLMAGGKRLRPVLALAAYEYCGGDPASNRTGIHYAMAALEMVHTYSLIHDDLPCMDDDDLRRGIPTCHKKFGEAVAVLAGDALHDVAFELMARTGRTEAVIELAQAIGTGGMLGGQMGDVEAEGKELTREEIIAIHQRKTAALIRCAVRVGGILAGADRRTLEVLTTFGEKIGLAFQIKDDILDIEGDRTLLGKNVGADSKRHKATYPKAVGIEQAVKDIGQLVAEAVTLVDGHHDNILKDMALFIGHRES